MFTRVAMLADFGKDFLYDDELVWHKWVRCGVLGNVGKSLDVQHGVIKGIEVFQYSMFLVIDHTQEHIGLFVFRKHTLFNYLIDRRRGQAEACINAVLNS